MATLSTLKTDLEGLTAETIGGFITAANATAWLNQAMHLVEQRIGGVRGVYSETLAADVGNTTFSTVIRTLFWCAWGDNTLMEIPWQTMRAYNKDGDGGSNTDGPTRYALLGNDIYFDYATEASGTLRYDAIVSSTDMSDDDDEPFGGNLPDADALLPLYAAGMVRMKDGSPGDSVAFKAQFAAALDMFAMDHDRTHQHVSGRAPEIAEATGFDFWTDY